MFYSQFILAKKGPLGTIWIAAHLERKLRKNQVADTDIGVSVDSILCPDVPIALRLSSHLLLGVVRIYSRKVGYLFDDCSETLLKIKQAFRSAAVDLPPEESKAPYHSITLPETFELDDFELPDNDFFLGNFVDHHISSREQITLQDSMDAVTYSTSKFGLDERFGDGDASGLDLDEELFLDKIGTGGHASERPDPQPSVGPMTPLKQEEHPETRADGADDYADLMEYAHAPCTPGLVEEPNLSKVQEVSACDDHLESEYHLGESTVNENLKNNTYGDKQEVDWSSHNNTNSDVIPMLLPEECRHQSGGLHSNLPKPQGESPPEANLENVQMESSSVSKPPDLLGEAKPLDPASEVPCMEDLQNEAVNKDNTSSFPVDKPSDHDQGPYETCLEKSACGIYGLTSTCDKVSEGVSTKDQGSLEAEVPCTVEIGSDWEKQLPDASELLSKNQDIFFLQNPETQACPEPADQACPEPADPSSLNVDVHEKAAPSEPFFLRPCNSNMEPPDISGGGVMSTDAAIQSDVSALATSEREETVMIGEGCSGTHNSEGNWKENHLQEHSLQEEIHAPSSEPDNQVRNASAHDRLMENLNNSAEVNLPPPEKLLSIPEELVDQHNNMLPEATPGVSVGFDEGEAGNKIILGKKRSFTESTLTEQSLNSVDSSRLVRFKRTIESVPDDDDLLSSILVGRSSVLKVKPTPRLSEVTSTKRTRSAQRTGVPKRKVLMDDTMVLHGDMIRQQLTSTEDIRRVRKKAPCTRTEISMIQKQHLEDDFFLESLLTGMSIELISLHSQMRDLSGITVCKNDIAGASLEIDADLRLPSDNVPSTKDKDVSFETVAEPVLSSHDGSLANAARPHLSSQNIENTESLNMGNDQGSDEPNVAEQNEVIISKPLLLDRDSEAAKSSEDSLLSNNRINEGDESLNMGNDKGSDEPNVAEQSEVIISEPLLFDRDSEAAKSSDDPLLSNNRMNEVDEINVEITTGEEQTKPTSDVGPTDDKNEDASGPSASVVQMNPITETSETNTSLNADTLASLPDQEKNASSAELEYAVMDVDNGQAISRDELVAKDGDIDAMFESESLVRDDVLSEMARDRASFELLLKSKQGELEYDERSEIHSATLGDTIVDSSYPAHVGLQDNGIMGNGESAEQPEAYSRFMMEAGGSFLDLNEREELDYAAAEIDTDFLNVDDDELTEMADDNIPDDGEARFTENTGWSSRTRAVSKYLQTLFVKEAEFGRKSISIDSLLIGKSRKEASRMFFEALVLKTRDYIHVEQPNSFDDISIKPRTRLMKSDF